MERRIIRTEFQSQAIFVRSFHNLASLPVRCPTNHVELLRVAQDLLRQHRFLQGYRRFAQVKIGVGKAEMGFAIVGIALDCGIEVCRCSL